MARIAAVNIPQNKIVQVWLTYIHGIGQKYSKQIADALHILYGGSCKPSNAEELFSNPDVDGGLIGGASLKSEDFLSIISS